MASYAVHKYLLAFNDSGHCTVRAPNGKLLKVARKDDDYYAWILVDKGAPERAYSFRAVMTGEDLDDKFVSDWGHVDTLFVGPWLVVHIFSRDGR